MKVIFIDCDGVLNSTRFFKSPEFAQSTKAGKLAYGSSQLDPQALAQLDSIVAATGAKLVISSSWRHIWDWHEVAEMFVERGFKNARNIIDATPTTPSDNRGEEISEWLALGRERAVVEDVYDPVTSWVIIDDVDEFDSEQHEHLVQTNPSVGLTSADVKKAIQILNH